MKAVCVRFCQCARTTWSLDPDVQMWVCSRCGLPSEAAYLGGAKDGSIPPLPRDRWGKASPIIDIESYKTLIVTRRAAAIKKVNSEHSTVRGRLVAN